MHGEHEAQKRGGLSEYARYLAGMDASMRQKVALTAAHLLCEGTVADMGTGSGSASLALAQLYPRLSVVGVDVSTTMVSLARERHTRPNLDFRVGDASAVVFARGSLDGILASSMLHHVTSFGGYQHAAAGRALAAFAEQLREHGVLVVRDFVDPGREDVMLELCADDGDESDDPVRCSTARLFERFAREFRSLAEAPGFALDRAEGDEGAPVRRYRTTHKLAAEFVLRKDYRSDWESEVKEEYTYFTQTEFEAAFEALGLRVLGSTPIVNPWIVKHRYRGKFRLLTLKGELLPNPPTNYLIVGERVPDGSGVSFRASEPCAPLGFLALEHYRHRETGHVWDLVRRPNATLDVVPWFEEQGTLYVLARASYPRPVLIAEADAAQPLDGSRAAPWVVEPLTLIQGDRPAAQTIEEALVDYVHLPREALHEFSEGSRYYPSPGGIAERVEATFVRISPTFVQRDVGARSGFSSSGRVQAIEAEQLVRAAHVGGLSDARLELNVYALLARLGRPPGPWLGEEVELVESPAPPARAEVSELLARPARRRFQRTEQNDAPYLSLRCRVFDELDRTGRPLATQRREYVMPRAHRAVTVSVAVLCARGGELLVGLDDDDLPAAQSFRGRSNLLVTPAFRLPHDVRSMAAAERFAEERLAREYGVRCASLAPLGGKYHPSPGATPEVVHPFVAVVNGFTEGLRSLHFAPLAGLVAHASAFEDGHLRVALWRTAHALGLLR